MILQTAGGTKSVSKLSWHRSPIDVIRYVSMAGAPVRRKIVAVRGRSWLCGSGIRWVSLEGPDNAKTELNDRSGDGKER